MKFLYPPKPSSTHINPLNPRFQNYVSLCQNWVVEKKQDGWAALAFIDENGQITYFNRHGERLVNNLIIESKAEFEKMDLPKQSIFGFEAIGHRTLKVKDKMSFYAVYMFQNKLQNNIPYSENKDLLKQIIKPVKNRIEVLDHFSEKQCPKGSFVEFYKDVIKDEECEGIILKDVTKPIRTSIYNSPILSYWVKFKQSERRKASNE